jgi:hypothetical protein
MKAKFVYESIGDILKPKDPENIMQSFGEDFNEIFKEVMLALVKNGYELQPMKEATKDYQDNVYSYRGKKIVAGDAAWIKLKSAEELNNMDFYFHDSLDDEDPSTDSIVHITKLEDGTYNIEVSVNFRGTWKTRITYDDPEFDDMAQVRNEEEVVPATLDLVNKAEKFLSTEIYKLKKYGENW